ncbi:hypothetical protein IWQ62_003465 [Dispira parvispora]|uniref:Uncharacterized protein n=1 Tax=Dispira parvispora TaxID=1520584 RepID=A0A9W8E2W3_9FUNG|nr:hypothetical protein IWQ62_003465 [Dispira parvispora]
MAADATTKPGGMGPVKLKKKASKVKRTKENGQEESGSSNSSGTASPHGEQADPAVHLQSTTSFPDLSVSADKTHPAQDIVPPVTCDHAAQETTDFPKPFAEVVTEGNPPAPVAPITPSGSATTEGNLPVPVASKPPSDSAATEGNLPIPAPPKTPSDSAQSNIPVTNPSVSVNDPKEFPPVQIKQGLEHPADLPPVPVEPTVEFEKSFADVAKDEPHTPTLAPALKEELPTSRNLAASKSDQVVSSQEQSQTKDEHISSETKEEPREPRPTPVDTPFQKPVPAPSEADFPSVTSSSCCAHAVVRRGWILGIVGGIVAVLLRHRNPSAARSAGTVGICITSLYGLRWVYNKLTHRS